MSTATVTAPYCNCCHEHHQAPESFCRDMLRDLAKAATKKVNYAKLWPKQDEPLPAAEPETPVQRGGATMTRGAVRATTNKLSEKQRAYAELLLGWIAEHGDAGTTLAAERRAAIDAGRLPVRTVIDTLKADLAAVKATASARRDTVRKATQVELPQVPAGGYALDAVGDEGNQTVFYVVWHGRNGYIGLNRQISDRQVRVPWAQVPSILARIAADTEGALVRYGRELGVCGHCRRTLTNDESRARGIGPVCARQRAM